MLQIFTYVLLFESVLALRLPSKFQKCNRNQPDLKACILRAAQDGISKLDQPVLELKLPNVNPFEVQEATLGAGKGTVAVEQKFKNCKLYGFHTSKLDEFVFDFQKKTLFVESVIPELILNCEYELNGKVLLLPVVGTGPATITLKNLHVTVDFAYEELKKRGRTYIQFGSSNVALNPGLITYNFENLFNGDKSLGDNINKVLNDNWKEVFEDVQEGYVEIVSRILVSVFNSFFAKVSIEEALD